MELKHTKLLHVAGLISFFLGLFLIPCAILEFSGILQTRANTTIEAAGIQLSYLIFVSGILVFISGFITILDIKKMRMTILQLIVAIFSLSWPIFVFIALFFAQKIICIRLLPTMLSSLFYIISLLIVLITNDELRAKRVKIALNSQISSMGKRKSQVNVSNAFQSKGKAKSHHKINISKVGNIFTHTKRHKINFYGGSRRRSGINIKNMGNLFGGRRR